MSTITLFSRRTWPSRLGNAAAAFVLAAFVIGVPIALSLGGSPFPAHWPHVSAAWRDLRAGYVPAVVLANVALLAGWCVWAFLSFEIVSEIRSVQRTYTSRRSAALGPLQPLVAKLVAAAVLSLPLTTVRPMLRPATASTVVLSAAQPNTRTTPAPAPSRAAEKQVALPTYTVRRGDTLWGIAQRYLGDPLRWKEIAVLNADRHEGSTEFTEPHWIYPGWTLVLPRDARGVPAGEEPVTGTAAAPHPAPDRHPEPSPASEQPSSRGQVAGDNARPGSEQRLAPTTKPHSPGRAVTTPPSEVGAPPRGPVAPRSSTAEHGVSARANTRSPAPARVPIAPIGGALLAAGLLGLLAHLRRVQMRHRRAGRRIAMPTGMLADVEQGLGAVADRSSADALDRATRLLGSALEGAPAVPDVLGAVVSSHAIDFLLAEPLSAPAPFVNATEASWRLDRRDPSVELALLTAEGLIPVLPALVSIGEDDDGVVMVNLEAGGITAIGGDAHVAESVATAVALELASASWVECLELVDVGIGTGEANPHYCTTVDRLSEAFGMIHQRHRELERSLAERGYESSRSARLREPTEQWSPLAVVSSTPLEETERGELAGIVEPERYGLAILVPEALEGAHWQLVACEDGTIELPMLGRRVRAQRISRGHLAGIASLLGLAASGADVAADAPPYDGIDAGLARRASAVNPAETAPTEDAPEIRPYERESAVAVDDGESDNSDVIGTDVPFATSIEDDEETTPSPFAPELEDLPDGGDAEAHAVPEIEPEEEPPATGEVLEVPVLFDEATLVVERADDDGETDAPFDVPAAPVEVGVLGRLAISDLAVEPERGKALELIVWLALHPNGASNDTMMTALWPRGISPSTAWNTRWDARRSLGTNKETGEERVDDGLVLSADVSTDWARFCQLAKSGRRAARHAALMLVRGRPFEGIEWLWVTMEGFVASVTADVTDLAVALGEEELDRQDFAAAIAAAEQGLIADPYDERLFRIIMRANDGLGNPSGVRAAMQQLESRVEVDVEPFESVHPETRALYNTLRARRDPHERGDEDPGGMIRRIH